MSLFFLPHIKNISSPQSFDKFESKHISKTLRIKNGDLLKITDGKGHLFTANVVDNHYKSCRFVIKNVDYLPPPTAKIHLAVAPTKTSSRFEWFVEKATEIGVTDISPIICQNSEREKLKIDRLKKITISAIKQSLRCHLPIIHPVSDFKDFIEGLSNYDNKCIAHCYSSEKIHLKSISKKKGNTVVLIGPEGDFSKEEVAYALKKDFISVSLGSSRLRTETAAILSCHLISLTDENS